MAYVVAIGQLIRELYKGQETGDIPERWKRLLAELGDKEQERSGHSSAS